MWRTDCRPFFKLRWSTYVFIIIRNILRNVFKVKHHIHTYRKIALRNIILLSMEFNTTCTSIGLTFTQFVEYPVTLLLFANID